MRYPFLALLAARPSHGYELKTALERHFGSVLAPLNAGQVYTTLGRLEHDGLIRGSAVSGDNRQKRVYELTPAGQAVLDEWLATPEPAARARDAFFLKLVLAPLAGVAEPRRLIADQRREYLSALRELTRERENETTVTTLLAEGTALHLEADLRWLELCEQRLFEEDDNARARG